MNTTPARDTLYTVLMLGGITGTGHTPDRSEKASELLDAFKAEVLTAAATEFRTHCPDDGTGDTAFVTCQCTAADHLDRTAKYGA